MVDQAFDDVVPEPVLQHFLSHAVRTFVAMAGGAHDGSAAAARDTTRHAPAAVVAAKVTAP